MYVCAVNACLRVCMCSEYTSGTHGSQNRGSDPLELELLTVVS